MRTFLFRLIGILQVAGGFYGLFGTGARILHSGHDAVHLIVLLVGLAAFALLLAAGALLIAGDARGTALSRWLQVAQMPMLATPWFSYVLTSGASVPLVLAIRHGAGVHVAFDIPTWHWTLALAGPSTTNLGVNLVALGAWLVLRFWR